MNMETSMGDTDKLKKMILENPDLPLCIFAGKESYSGEYCYNLAKVSKQIL